MKKDKLKPVNVKRVYAFKNDDGSLDIGPDDEMDRFLAKLEMLDNNGWNILGREPLAAGTFMMPDQMDEFTKEMFLKTLKRLNGNGIISNPPKAFSFPAADWPADAPEYHSAAGWAFQKEQAEEKLRVTFGREYKVWDGVKWLLEQGEFTGDVRYFRIATRLMEIEKEKR